MPMVREPIMGEVVVDVIGKEERHEHVHIEQGNARDRHGTLFVAQPINGGHRQRRRAGFARQHRHAVTHLRQLGGGERFSNQLGHDLAGRLQKNSDGTGAEDLLIESELLQFPMSWSKNGESIVYVVIDPKTLNDVWLLPLAGDRKTTPLLNSKFGENFPQISPDGKWLA